MAWKYSLLGDNLGVFAGAVTVNLSFCSYSFSTKGEEKFSVVLCWFLQSEEETPLATTESLHDPVILLELNITIKHRLKQ